MSAAVDAWLAEVLPLVRVFQETFEENYGYEPGDNPIERRVALGLDDHDLPPALRAFYERVVEVSLVDLPNGYRIHPVELVVDTEVNGLPTHVPELSAERFVVFGSSGGGDLFVMPQAGGPVYELSPGPVQDNVYTSMGIPPRVLAEDFEGFLSLIVAELRRATAD
ncbi:hypothetical protein B0I31_110215 [Saccharothrix carnea]|uniref:SMI1/KNR4 family protein SUKH-1 n=1 Tax=Saccharothrix carnea TaxID=1280637 RepID=A0A2P8I3S6_SACCR|nr:SMI1/KNR4 family protein [Saccharothrix carnea]PSL53122.1 hypothetical protein B0I31_110215 [Saccharothrix carnea]